MRKIFLLTTFIIINLIAKENFITTDNFVVKFSNYFKIKTYKCDTFLRGIKNKKVCKYYSALSYAVPNKFFNGKQWYVKPKALVNVEQLIKSFIIYKQIKLYDERKVNHFLNERFNNWKKEGYTKKNKIYLATLLCNQKNKLQLPENIFLTESNFKNILYKISHNFKVQPKCYQNKKIKKINYKQAYFPDGPLYNNFTSEIKVPKKSVFHQYSAIFGKAVATTKKVNTVGIWGEAESIVNKGKVWGGFFTANNNNNKIDSQLVGIEVDVVNRGKAGIYPNNSKVGMQIVSIGDNDNSAAIEIISDNKSKWKNAILVDKNSIAQDGAIIGVSQKTKMRVGIDFSNSKFSDSAIRISNNSYIRFDDSDGKNAALLKNDSNNYFNIIMGRKGLVIRNNDNTKTLVLIKNNGDVILEKANLILNGEGGRMYKIYVDKNGNIKTKLYKQRNKK